MQVHIYGTRGSTPGMPRGSQRYGGATTCLRVDSECIPPGFAFAVDTGSGFTQFSKDALKEGIKKIAILYTHYHHDHTQGLFLAPHTFMAELIKVWGPYEHNIGPREVYKMLLRSPLFPVDFSDVAHRFEIRRLNKNIGTQVLIIHPRGGFHLLPIDVYRRREADGKQLRFNNGSYELPECLVVSMYKTEHPEYAISYRFDEKPTGRVFVFLTDHEKTSGFAMNMLKHLRGANLVIQDGQYAEDVYCTRTSGFGHATPQYCAETMVRANIERMGITHHDPDATDEDIEQRLAEAQEHLALLQHPQLADKIFACGDDQLHTV